MKLKELLASDWFVGVFVALLFLAAYGLHTAPLQSLENKLYDAAVAANTRPADSPIVLVAIDEASIDRMGPWPWPRKVFAEMIQNMSAAGARIIGVDILFEKSMSDPNLDALKALSDLLGKSDQGAESLKALADAQKSLDVDQVLADAAAKAGNVILPFEFETDGPNARAAAAPDYASRIAPYNVGQGGKAHTAPIQATRLSYPFPRLGEAAAGIGFSTEMPDRDGTVRAIPLIIQGSTSYLPSLPLILAARQKNLGMDDIRVELGGRIELGGLDIPVDEHMRFYPGYYGNASGSFSTYPFHEVFTGKVAANRFRDKIVLIGATAAEAGDLVNTPVKPGMSGLELNAHALNAILGENAYSRPPWAAATELLLLALAAAYLALVLPRLGMLSAVIISLAVSGALIVMGFLAIGKSGLLVFSTTPAFMLIVGHVALSARRAIRSSLTERGHRAGEIDPHHTNKMLGLSFQSQGMLDLAFEKYRKCHLDEEMLSILYSLGIDFENKRQFNKAISVFEHIATADPNYQDIQARIERARMASDTLTFSSKTQGVSALLVSGDNKPMLGRYEIIRELGKGAMGTVYLGLDPKINREVAIKTMALSQEFDETELADIKERFFREAETAGRLKHPNIVTIYDAGEEHDLAYIAMEFLTGSDLTPFTKKGKLMAPSTVLKICGKVAEALNYAHGMKVVHRDIKPGNIMLLKDRSIKVTDFGIARLTATTRTKTGVVLGTPSYMSPEQLSGKHIDGRSDLFSLGVTLYEMLAGQRPFSGDSMATLMFQIANEPHPDIREHRPDLPDSVSKLIDSVLAKNMDDRCANGAEMVQAIVQCLRDLAAMEKTA